MLAFIFYCISRKPKPEPVPTDVQKDAEQQAAQQNVLVEQQAAAQVSAANTQAKDAWDTALRDAQSRAADADSTNPFLDDVSKKMRQ